MDTFFQWHSNISKCLCKMPFFVWDNMQIHIVKIGTVLKYKTSTVIKVAFLTFLISVLGVLIENLCRKDWQ